jgi:hypothetical protein
MQWCTVADSVRFAGALVLAESLATVYPEEPLHAIVADGADRVSDQGGLIRLLSPEDVGLDAVELRRRRTLYSDQELACSLKPPLMATLLREGGEPVVYLDSDILMIAALDEVIDLAERHAVVLTPHRTRPLQWSPGGNEEEVHIRAGVFNAGLLAVGRHGGPFLDWWEERTRRDIVSDGRQGSDQRWLPLVPALFDHAVTRDPGINVTRHALQDRDVEWRDDVPYFDGGPLRCFHFSGFDPAEPDVLGQAVGGFPPPSLAERPGVARLLRAYAERLACHGARDAWPARPSNGLRTTAAMRRAYGVALRDAEAGRGPEPPTPSDGQAFLDWLAEPADGTWLTRYLLGRREERPDLTGVRGHDAALLAIWARETPEPGASAALLGLAAERELVPGAPVDAAVVHALGEALLAGAPAPTTGGDAVLRWLRAPPEPGMIASRYVVAVRDLREDLQRAFPDVPGADDAALMGWALAHVGAPPPDTLSGLLVSV